MKSFLISLWILLSAAIQFPAFGAAAKPPVRHTSVSIVGDDFYINGRPTYENRRWNGRRIEGLLLNSRMVQGVFDDRNAQTVSRWAYPDTGKWDAERNTREFLAAMPEWRQHGLLAFTINLQGGSPEGYSKEQPWHNSAIESDGSLRPDAMSRLERILNRADELGLAVILGYFYFGQDERIADETSVMRAVDNLTGWLFDRGYRNVLVEINNECNVRYDHAVLRPDRVHELIEHVRDISRDGRHLLVGTSYGGGTIPKENVARVSDFLLVHGNGVSAPNRISEMVRQTKKVSGYRGQPILFNEDDHFDFDKPANNFVAAVGEHASWGYFDPGKNDYRDGYQSPPVNWGLNTERKKAFFKLVSEISGVVPERVMIRNASSPTIVARTSNRTSIQRISYHGWTNVLLIGNGRVEAVIVPQIGRVMQFRFVGEEEGPLWNNRALDGKAPNQDSPEWGNFGGDKTWPSPQSNWPKITGRAWPPPRAFDSMPVTAHDKMKSVTLVSAVDPHYGIQTTRRIELDPKESVMRITTTYEKKSGEPIKLGVWIITQLNSPDRVLIPLPHPSRNPRGYDEQSKDLPANLKVDGNWVSLPRDPKKSTKIGTDAQTLIWIGEKQSLRIDSLREGNMEYPDNGSSAEVYTNPDPLPYVELEMLGPLFPMKIGTRIEQLNTYTLFHRGEGNPESEARRISK